MKKAAISTFVIVAFAIYSLHARNEQNSVTVTAPTSLQTKSSNSASTTTSASASSSQNGAHYKDGTYTGTAADAYYGYIQVEATVSGGALTNVKFLQYPNDRRESVEINTQAMPMLKQEAIQAQTAHVDGVSGASDTSAAFIESLGAALNQAKL